jgi:hypothetical protein
LIFGFVTWLPSFFVQEGLSIVTSSRYSLIMSLGAPFGSAIGAFSADSWGRKPTIVGASLLTIVLGGIYPFVHLPMALMTVGFLLTVPIYILVATLFGFTFRNCSLRKFACGPLVSATLLGVPRRFSRPSWPSPCSGRMGFAASSV